MDYNKLKSDREILDDFHISVERTSHKDSGAFSKKEIIDALKEHAIAEK